MDRRTEDRRRTITIPPGEAAVTGALPIGRLILAIRRLIRITNDKSSRVAEHLRAIRGADSLGPTDRVFCSSNRQQPNAMAEGFHGNEGAGFEVWFSGANCAEHELADGGR